MSLFTALQMLIQVQVSSKDLGERLLANLKLGKYGAEEAGQLPLSIETRTIRCQGR